MLMPLEGKSESQRHLQVGLVQNRRHGMYYRYDFQTFLVQQSWSAREFHVTIVSGNNVRQLVDCSKSPIACQFQFAEWPVNTSPG